MKIAYFLTHPIQYQSPMIRVLVGRGFEIEVVYGPMAADWAADDPELGRSEEWDIPLLDGYPFRFLETRFAEGPLGFFCLRSKIKEVLREIRPDFVWLHGWGDVFSVAAWNVAWSLGVPIMLRGESHLKCLKGGPIRRWLHRQILQRCFRSVAAFLAVGSENRAFYRSYGVQEKQIFHVPYAVDNERFKHNDFNVDIELSDWREKLGISSEDIVIGVFGKLKRSKRPDLIIKALRHLNEDLVLKSANKKIHTVFVGDGPLRRALEAKVKRDKIERVHFLGFQNQTRLPALYRLVSFTVLPSDFEPWGLVVNESMCAERPVLVSDKVGAAADLVKGRATGKIFQAGSREALANAMREYVHETDKLKEAGEASGKAIDSWSYSEDVTGVSDALGYIRRNGQHQLPKTWGYEFTKPLKDKVAVAYVGVHQAFQLALAAQEGGVLNRFYTSLIDAPGRWGAIAAKWFGPDRLINRRLAELDGRLIEEYPWPLFYKFAHDYFMPGSSQDWVAVCSAFDKYTAAKFKGDPCKIYVGTETCALLGLQASKECGAIAVLDCPQLHPTLLQELLEEAAERAKISAKIFVDVPEMAERKQHEYELADHLLIYSEVHRRSFMQAGFQPEKIFECPLWVNPQLWYPEGGEKPNNRKLKVLFAGSVNLRKGIPFLLEAFRLARGAWDLTLVGPIWEECRPFLDQLEGSITLLPPQNKVQLRKIYSQHDLFVLPSVVDTFGFVALEAMACGTPALVSSNCGAPVPDEGWRFSAMNAHVLCEKICAYVHDRDKLLSDSQIARQFASEFTPERYRRSILTFFRELLTSDGYN